MSGEQNFQNLDILLKRWLKRCRESQLSHHLMAESLEAKHWYLGVATIAIAAIAGTSALSASIEAFSKLAIGLLSLLSAVLASLQTFLKLEDRAASHKIAAAKYGEVRRRLELAMSSTEDEKRARLKNAEVDLNKLALESPGVPKRVFDKALNRAT